MKSAAEAPVSLSEDGGGRPRASFLTAALVLVAVMWTLAFVGFSLAEDLLAWDVRFAYLPAAEAVLDGHSPYPERDDPILEDQKGYVYPPQLVVALIPLTRLPIDMVAVLVTFALLALVGLTLWILDVRDLRCYAAAFLWMPTTSGVLLGNVSIPLAFALAVAWRYRETLWRPALAVGLAVSAKLLLWPVFVWLVATRRLRAAALAALVGAVVTLAAWAAIGFDGLRTYPDLLERLSEIQADRSYSIVGMSATLGLGSTVGNALTVALGLLLLAACVQFARRSDDPRSFVCAIAATLVLSPIVWLHYIVVLLVPMAILRPRFSALWLLPILLWASPRPGYAEGFQTFLPALVASALVAVLLIRPDEGRGVPAAVTT
jgi:alpha-1,2-mannosyltransferase